MLEISIEGEQLVLLPQKALYWPAKKSIIAADLHWGKTAHFRKNGIAIPLNTQQNDEIRLSQIVREHKAERLIIAGDMFHSKTNNEVEGFSHWRNAHKELQVELVVGNHDILPEELYKSFDITLHDEVLKEGPFTIIHDVPEQSAGFYIHGHVHPAFAAGGKGQRKLTLPCFAQSADKLILPAFGGFTGTYKIQKKDFKHIYLVADTEVIQWA